MWLGGGEGWERGLVPIFNLVAVVKYEMGWKGYDSIISVAFFLLLGVTVPRLWLRHNPRFLARSEIWGTSTRCLTAQRRIRLNDRFHFVCEFTNN